jgi:hypothetical protein
MKDLSRIRDDRKREGFPHTNQGLIKMFSGVYYIDTWDSVPLLGQCFKLIPVHMHRKPVKTLSFKEVTL